MHSSLIAVFRKELLEITRDRKTLVFMIALPLLLIPVLIQLATAFVADAEQRAATATLDYAIFGADELPTLTDAFAAAPGFTLTPLDNPAEISAAVADGRIDLALVVSPPRAGGQHTVEVHYDNASLVSRILPRTRQVIDGSSADLRRARLEASGITAAPLQQAVIEPVVLIEQGTASMREVLGERLGGMLPYVFIIFCFLGAMYPAIDLAAGEKERGTLETLLLVPIARRQIVLGKSLVIFTAGVISALLTLLGLGGWLLLRGSELRGALGEVVAAIGATDIALVAAMLVPTAAIFASLLLGISIFAKSFKEAQSYMTALQLAVIVPAFLANLPGVELNWKTAAIPLFNSSLAIKELIKGTMDYSMLAAIVGSTVVIAGLLLWASVWWFDREDVLFRQ